MLGVQKITVRSDDNLKSLAERFGPSPEAWPALVAANPHKRTTFLGTFETLTPGERLVLPYGWRQEMAPPRPDTSKPPGITIRTDAGDLASDEDKRSTALAGLIVGGLAIAFVVLVGKDVLKELGAL